MADRSISVSDTNFVHPTKDGKVPIKEEKVGVNFKWPKPMSRHVLLFLAEHVRSEGKPNHSFKPQILHAAVKSVNEAFPKTIITQRNILNHLRTLKTRWKAIQNLHTTLSGAPWDDNKKMFFLGEDEYKTFVAANPKLADYVNKPIELYEEMSIVCGNDFATGAWTKSLAKGSKSLGSKLDGGSSSAREPIDLDSTGNTNNDHVDSACNNEVEEDVEFIGTSKDNVEEVLTPPSKLQSQRKVKRAKFDDSVEVMGMIAENIGKVANALTVDIHRNFAKDLHDVMMALPGYDKAVKSSAYDYLLRAGNEGFAHGFLNRDEETQNFWMDDFIMSENNTARFSMSFN